MNDSNILLEFFTPENGIDVYDRFCRAHFPKMLVEHYDAPGYFESFGAQAFISNTEYGVLIRDDIDLYADEVFRMSLHEISHLYCTRNEIDEGNFFDRYCMESGPDDGMLMPDMRYGAKLWLILCLIS